jgi:hypothetical protein
MFLDDGILAIKSLEKFREFVHIIRTDLQDAGFIVNNEKSSWEPSNRVK